MRNVNSAIAKAKPGTTIILAPGVYTQSIKITRRTDLTIAGAANGATILAPPRDTAITVTLSSGIDLSNLWLRPSGSQARGLTVLGSSVSLNQIETDHTAGDGVVVASFDGAGATLTATASHFDSVQTGSGMWLQTGAQASINGCTFSGNGTAPNVTAGGSGLVLTQNAQATIVNSQFSGNLNAGLVAMQTSQVTITGSTFSSNRQGDGALFFDQTTVNLRGNTFASNGEVAGPTTGLDGVELAGSFTGTASISGNDFEDNTGYGLFIGSAPNVVQVAGNVFQDNYVGISLDGHAAIINAVIQGNSFAVSAGAPAADLGLFAVGSGVTATVGGQGSLANVFSNFIDYHFIAPDKPGDPSVQYPGYANLSLDGNTYLQNGIAIAQSLAVYLPGS